MSSSEVGVRLNPSFHDWYEARAVVEEELKSIGKALERIKISSQLQDAFTRHLFAVHRQWCEACPPGREPGLSGGGLEKEAATSSHTGAAAAHNPMAMKQKTSVGCVSAFTQTTDMNCHRLQMNAQGGVGDNNDDISETSVPSAMTCRVEDEESQADVNRTLEKPANEKVVSTKFIKLEVSEDEPFPDVLFRLEKDHYDVDMDSSKEETPSQPIHEEEGPSQHTESGEQSHLERTNTVSDQHIKHERDSQDHCDFDMAGSSSEAMSHQGTVEEIPLDRAGGQLHLEGMTKISDQPIKHERDSQGHCDVDMAGCSSEVMSHQGPVEEIPLDRAAGTNHTMSALSGDVLSHDGVFKDPCLDSYKTVQKTLRADGKMIFQCSHCSNSYSCVNEYQKHLSTHTSHKPYHCSICSKRFSQKNSFDTHTCMMQHKEKLFQCKYCNYQFSTKGNLNVHLRKHTGDMPYKCSICDRRFWSKGAMKYHMSTHSGEKPYSCDICDYRCILKGQLRVHMRVHTGEKPYECSICGKRYRDSTDFRRHMIMHTGQKPYLCSICGKGFTRYYALNRHMMVHR